MRDDIWLNKNEMLLWRLIMAKFFGEQRTNFGLMRYSNKSGTMRDVSEERLPKVSNYYESQQIGLNITVFYFVTLKN